MTVLIGKKLLQRLIEKNPKKRLVVSPLLEPVEQLTNSQASIDVRLGSDFRLASPANIGVLDEFADAPENSLSGISGMYRQLYVPLGSAVTIHPHQFMLAVTLEYLRLPEDLMAYVVGRSTLGRLGLIIATAIGIHPKFYGPLTLELRNLGEAPLRLYPGQTIAQLFFHQVEPKWRSKPLWSGTNEITGQYSGAIDPIPRRISSEVTENRLVKLCKGQREGERRLRGITQRVDAP